VRRKGRGNHSNKLVPFDRVVSAHLKRKKKIQVVRMVEREKTCCFRGVNILVAHLKYEPRPRTGEKPQQLVISSYEKDRKDVKGGSGLWRLLAGVATRRKSNGGRGSGENPRSVSPRGEDRSQGKKRDSCKGNEKSLQKKRIQQGVARNIKEKMLWKENAKRTKKARDHPEISTDER